MPPPSAVIVKPPKDPLAVLRKLLWLYIALWVIEGALRKWALPTLANPLLVVRDPVLLLIYAIALAKGVFPNGFLVWVTAIVGMLALVVSEVATTTPWIVTAYGFRSDFLHLPLIFLMPRILNRDDVRLIGKWILIAALPMAALVMLQFESAPGARINAGAGGDSVMLESAYGHIRPSGTFSFTNGLSGFTLLVAAFFLHQLLEKRVYKQILWLAAGPALVVLIVLSGSRAAVGAMVLLLATVVLICLVQGRYWRSSFKLLGFAAAAVVALGSFAVFQQGLEIFTYRFTKSGGGVQSGFVDRFIEGFAVPFTVAKETPAGGEGLGMGTNVAAGLLVGKRTFMVAEGEFARVIMEDGPVAGMTYLALRFAIVTYLGLAALRSLRERAYTLPPLLFCACFNDMLQAQFSQPTALGYATIAAGLCLSSNRPPLIEPKSPAAPTSIVTPLPVRRGRSEYAERLHGAGTA